MSKKNKGSVRDGCQLLVTGWDEDKRAFTILNNYNYMECFWKTSL